MITTWLLMNSLGLAVVAFVLYLTLRQMGFVLYRVAPPGARGTPEGPRIGENIRHALPEWWKGEERPRATLMIFGSDLCSICKRIREAAGELARVWNADADILLVYDAVTADQSTPLERVGRGLYFMKSAELRGKCGANFVPFALVTDASGNVIGKGLVNEIGHVESLLELEKRERRQVAAAPVGAGHKGAEA